MIIHLTDVSERLAKRYSVPWAFMTERVSEIAGQIADEPCLYRERTGTLTELGETYVVLAVCGAWINGTMDRQLTAWCAQ